MLAIPAAILFALIALLTFLVACGLPLGEYTMGGHYKVLPKYLRVMAFASFVIQLFAIIIVLQAGGFIAPWFSHSITKVICMVFAAYLSLNTVTNLLSKSKKEKYVMTPISLIASVCFWIIALKMQ